MRTRLTPSALLLALLPSLGAQPLPVPTVTRSADLDSGYLDHSGLAPATVFAERLRVADAAWLRLLLGHTNLPDGSHLRLTSALDGAVQRLDARSLRDYGGTSAYFNGGEVLVELIAGPGTKANRVRVDRVVSGPLGMPESICGNTDDRQLSTDPRVGRAVSGSSACTWWLINEFTILTAGHCTGDPGVPWIVGFNIPLSMPDGTLVHPPPDDQYPIDTSTLQRVSSGVGQDWAVIASHRNSNHGLYPGQKQGSWFTLGAVPSQVSGVDIRITGNGRVSAPVPPTWNAVQKTHLGPRANTGTANAISYRTDTTGGNSGSPIIHEATGEAIGIHTHGGCNATGGRNSGTRIDRADLKAAIDQVRGSKVAGEIATFGQACPGSAGVPNLALSGVPDVGGQVIVQMSNLPPAQIGALLIGFSDSTWLGNSLPMGLAGLGMGGCTLYTSIDVNLSLGTGSGNPSHVIAIPGAAALIGLKTFCQFLSTDPGAPTPIPATLTDAGRILIGG